MNRGIRNALIDMEGTAFGRLTVIGVAAVPEGRHGGYLECLCECGTTKAISASQLVRGHTKSCGCYRREIGETRFSSGLSVGERFLLLVSPEPNSGCWLWTGACNRYGYAMFKGVSGNGSAHRISHVLFKGPIPSGLDIDHKCRVRCCVNPEHLEPVTKRENKLRSWDARRRIAKGELNV